MLDLPLQQAIWRQHPQAHRKPRPGEAPAPSGVDCDDGRKLLCVATLIHDQNCEPQTGRAEEDGAAQPVAKHSGGTPNAHAG